jgi:hypothetical protein
MLVATVSTSASVPITGGAEAHLIPGCNPAFLPRTGASIKVCGAKNEQNNGDHKPAHSPLHGSAHPQDKHRAELDQMQGGDK